MEQARGGAVARGERAAVRVDDRVATGLALLGVCLAAILPYAATVRDYFLGDDFGLIYLFSNKPTFHVLTLFTRAWTEDVYGIHADELRPTLAFLYQFDSLWGQNNPLGYHLSSLTLHVLCSLLVYAIARRVAAVGRPAAAFAAVLFAVLPPHAETVAWISGRADSIPTLFYLSTFLGFALWRRTGRSAFYFAAVVAFFLNLFSKQSAITMPAMLLAYDLLVGRRAPRPSWGWVGPHLPFVGMTAAYIALRLLLFGNAVREQSITPAVLQEFAIRQATYVKLLAVGSARMGADLIRPEMALAGRLIVWALLVLAVLLVLVELWRVLRGRPGELRGKLLFFGPVWWLICIVPLVVTYEAPRHLYQASVGPMVALGLLFALAWQGDRPRRFATALAATALVLASARLVERPIDEYHRAAQVSAIMTADLRRELATAPEGSLVVVGAPLVGPSNRYHTWLWMWSLPYAVMPPFLPAGLNERVSLVSPPDAYCCPRPQWFEVTRRSVATWATRPDQPPAIVLRWNAWSGILTRHHQADEPDLRERLLALGAAATAREMCEHLDGLIGGQEQSCAGS